MNQNMINDKEQQIEQISLTDIRRSLLASLRETNSSMMFTDIYSYVKSFLFLMVLLTVGTTSAWGQEGIDYSGTYYIASDFQTPNTTTRNYNPTTHTDNFYMCPTENWISFNTSGATYDTWTTGDDKPFLTTYKINAHNDYDKTKAIYLYKGERKESYDDSFYNLYLEYRKYEYEYVILDYTDEKNDIKCVENHITTFLNFITEK